MSGHTAFIVLAVVTIAVGYPLWRRWVPRNRWYGLRVPATLADPVVWYEANAAVGRDFILLGAVILGIALLLPGPWAVGLCLALGVTGSVVSLTRASRLATRLLSARGEKAS